MPSVKYIGNADSAFGATAIDLERSEEGEPRSILLGGEAVQMSGEEFARLRNLGMFLLEEVDEASEQAAERSATQQAPVQTASQSASSFLSQQAPPTTGGDKPTQPDQSGGQE